MRITITALSVAGLICLGTQGLGQDTAPSDALDLGEPVAPREGQIYVAESFSDWDLRCIRAPEGMEDRCNMYQLLSNADDAPVAEFNLFRLPLGGQAVAGANVVVPLETLLTEQLTLSIDNGEARRYPFTYCNSAGCVARVGLTQADIDALKRGVAATLRVVPAAAPEDDFLLTMSLAGFTAGFDKLEPVE